MATKRTPIHRQPEPKITPAAIRLFDAMRRCRCTCAPGDWGGEYWKHTRCPGCERWWRLQNDLCDELRTPIWQFPCMQHPEAKSPYPPGCQADLNWKPDLEAQEQWQALAEASREAKREARRARKAAEARGPPPRPLGQNP